MAPSHRSSVDSTGQDVLSALNTPRASSSAATHTEHYDLRQQGPTGALELEMGLKEKTRVMGDVVHVPPLALEERREMVDLGNGMEEVVVVEWLPHDPEVHSRSICLLDETLRMMDD